MNSNSYHLWNVDFHNHNDEVAAKHIAAQRVLHCLSALFSRPAKNAFNGNNIPNKHHALSDRCHLIN